LALTESSKHESNGIVADTSEKDKSGVDGITRGFSTLSISLVLLAIPILVSLSLMFRIEFSAVFTLWSCTSVLVPILLSIFSIYAMLKEEALVSRGKNLEALKHDLTYLFRYKHITIPFSVLSLAAGLGTLIHLFSPIFSLELIYAAVIILAFESIFHSLYHYWPRSLKSNSKIQSTFLTAIIIIGLFISLFIIGTASVLVISFVFGGIILVTGIGMISIIDITATDLSRIQLRGRNLGYVSVLILFLLLTVWTWLSSNFAAEIFRNSVTSAIPSIYRLYTSEFQALLTGLNISFFSVLAALIAGIAYFLYFTIRKKSYEKEGRFVFLLTSIPLAGFITFYLAILVDGDWTALIGTGNNLISYTVEFLPSIALFAVGYSQIVIELPRKTSRLLLLEENKFIISLTWLIIFSAFAEFLSWLVYGKPGSFIFEVDVLQWFGIPIGIVLISAKHLRGRRNKRTAPS
jgi:hypothetical protein